MRTWDVSPSVATLMITSSGVRASFRLTIASFRLRRTTLPAGRFYEGRLGPEPPETRLNCRFPRLRSHVRHEARHDPTASVSGLSEASRFLVAANLTPNRRAQQ